MTLAANSKPIPNIEINVVQLAARAYVFEKRARKDLAVAKAYNVRAIRIGAKNVRLLANVCPAAASGVAIDKAAVDKIESIVGAHKAPVVQPRADHKFRPRREVKSRRDVMQIHPPDLICQAGFVVRRRVDLVEGRVQPIVRILVARGVVVFPQPVRVAILFLKIVLL